MLKYTFLYCVNTVATSQYSRLCDCLLYKNLALARNKILNIIIKKSIEIKRYNVYGYFKVLKMFFLIGDDGITTSPALSLYTSIVTNSPEINCDSFQGDSAK